MAEKNWIPYEELTAEQKAMVDSEDGYGRAYAASCGYGFDRLIDDKDWFVRETVVRQGYGLEKLINDEDPDVRCAVVRQGYGLDWLINDQVYCVLKAVSDHLVNNSLTIDQWIAQNPAKCALPENRVRVQVEQHDDKQWSAAITDYREPDNERSWVCYGNTPEAAAEKCVKSAEAQQMHIPEAAVERGLKASAEQSSASQSADTPAKTVEQSFAREQKQER